MELKLDWISIVNIIGFVNGIFLSVVIIFFKKGKKVTNYLFASVVIILTLIIGSSLLLTTNLYFKIPHAIGILPRFYLALGPCLLLYILSLTRSDFKFNWIKMLHFIPLCADFVIMIPFFILSGDVKREILTSNLSSEWLKLAPELLFRLLHVLTYFVYIIHLLKKHTNKLKENFSTIRELQLVWINKLTIIYFSIWTTYVLFILFRFSGETSMRNYSLYFSVWEPLLIYYFGYKGMVQPEIISKIELIGTQKKYEQSSLTKKMAEEYLIQLKDFMENEKPYVDNMLSINKLSKKTRISERFISQIINEHLNQNFYDFINSYRIKEVKSRLENPRNSSMNIMEIAYDCGYNSKSSFNTAFKKHTGMSPSQYRNKSKKSM